MPQLVHTSPVSVPGPPVKPQWQERTIVFRLPSLRVVALDCWKYGPLAVHATWESPDLPPYTVSHWSSNVTVFRSRDVEDAVARAEWMWERSPRAFFGDEVDLRAMDGEVLAWL